MSTNTNKQTGGRNQGSTQNVEENLRLLPLLWWETEGGFINHEKGALGPPLFGWWNDDGFSGLAPHTR